VAGEPSAEEHLTVADDDDADPRLFLDALDRIGDADRAAREQVGAQSAPVNEPAQKLLPGQLLKVTAGLAETGSAAENLTDPEHSVHQVVEPDSARGQVAPRLTRLKFDAPARSQLLDHLGFDERQIAANARIAPIALAFRVAIAAKTHASTGMDFADRRRPPSRLGRHVDVLDTGHGLDPAMTAGRPERGDAAAFDGDAPACSRTRVLS
jgi:hypothetical protein